jgi:cytochrome P450
MRDERLYPNADQFHPERFMEQVDAETEKKKDPRNYVFGFGRRCVQAPLFWALIYISLPPI